MMAAARSPADEYALLFGRAGALANNMALYRNLPFDSQRDFDPIARYGSVPNALVVGKDSPARSLADFVAMARANPGAVTARRARQLPGHGHDRHHRLPRELHVPRDTRRCH